MHKFLKIRARVYTFHAWMQVFLCHLVCIIYTEHRKEIFNGLPRLCSGTPSRFVFCAFQTRMSLFVIFSGLCPSNIGSTQIKQIGFEAFTVCALFY